MIRIIQGGFYSDAYEAVKSDIYTLTERGERVFLIVPEQQAVIAEKELIAILPSSAPITFELTNFTRLANTVYRSLGGIAGKYSDKGKESLIMWRTLTELSPFLSMTDGRGEISAGLVTKALSAVAEMKSVSATPAELAELCEDERVRCDARLANKLSDVSKIMLLYKKLLEEKYASVSDECERLAEKLEENPAFFSDAHFFVSGFTSFTEPQYRVLSALMRRAPVSVHLTLPRGVDELFEYSEIRRTREKILAIADKAGIQKKIFRHDAPRADANPLLYEASGLLWRNFGKIDNDSLQNHGDTIRIFEASDPYEECDFVAADIKRRVMGGARWRDFAIVARSSDKYAGIIDSSLAEAKIPAFISKRKDISSYEPIKLIYTAFATVRTGFVREDLLSYAKCRLCGISAEACDEFELYTEKWQINKEGFTNGIFWNMSPDGYSTRKKKGSDETLVRINATRDSIVEPLIKLRENLAEAKTVRQHATALVKFLSEISLEERIEARRRELAAHGELAAAEENGRLWDIICSSLDTLVEVLGEVEIDSRGFESQLRVVLSEADVGKIPAFHDEVTVGSADMIRLSDKKHVYLIGVNQGEFPRTASSSSYFTERDRATLAELGLATDGGSEISYARELFFFTRAFSAAKESVTLLYSTRNAAFSAASADEIINRIRTICNDRILPVKISEIPAAERIYFPAMTLDLADDLEIKELLTEVGLDRYARLSGGKISNTEMSIGSDVLSLMYPESLSLTQTRIDTYVGCPFAYYLRYNLRLSENERARFDARNIGTFIHAVLENFFAELRLNGESASDITQEKKQDMVARSAKKYLNAVSDAGVGSTKRTEILLDRLCRAAMPVVDGLCEELRECDFVPQFFELKIESGSDGLPAPAAFKSEDGNDVFVYGSIDRVDTYKNGEDVYVRVIDYKTGKKSFSPSDIGEGRNLQMFLYLKAIVESDNKSFKERVGVGKNGKLIPAGVIYVKADLNDVTVPHADEALAEAELKKMQERHGMILDDEVSIEAMNKDFLPIKLKKDGKPDIHSKKYLYTYVGWDELNAKISDKVLEISTKMRSGDISTTDKKKDAPCDYCKFKPICRKVN